MSGETYPDMSAFYNIQFEQENRLKEKIAKLEAELVRTKRTLETIKNMSCTELSYKDMITDIREIAKAGLDLDYKPLLLGRYNNDN